MATIVQVVHDLVRGTLAQLVGAIISWTIELAATVGLATPLVIEQVTTRVTSLAERLGTRITKLVTSCKNLGGILDSLKALFHRAKTLFDQLLRGAGGLHPASTAETVAAPRSWSNLAPSDPLFPGRTVPLDRLSDINGRFQYIVREDGSLVVGRGGHIDLSRGRDVLAAGEVRVVNGEVRMLNNASGHYKPEGSIAQIARSAFEQQTGLVVRDNAWQTVVH